jgi:hypothetical protein
MGRAAKAIDDLFLNSKVLRLLLFGQNDPFAGLGTPPGGTVNMEKGPGGEYQQEPEISLSQALEMLSNVPDGTTFSKEELIQALEALKK